MARYKSADSALYITKEGTPAEFKCAGGLTISVDADVETWNCLGKGGKSKEAVGSDWKIEFDGKMTVDGKGQYDSLVESLKGGAEIDVKAFLNVGSNITGYGGKGLIKSVTMQVTAPGLWEFSCSIEGIDDIAALTTLPTGGAGV